MFSILDIKNNKTDFKFFWWDFSINKAKDYRLFIYFTCKKCTSVDMVSHSVMGKKYLLNS